MDFGLMGIDGFAAEPNKCSNGSGPKPTKHERSDPFQDDDDNRVFDCKIPRISDELGLRSDNNTNNNNINNNSFPKQQMLSFSNNNNSNSNTKSEVDKNGQNLTFSCYQYSSYPRNLPGLGGGNMNGSFTGIRGPFTPAQWIELEHQAMIYKYFTANVPVPANLLLPIRKALTSSGFPGFSLGSYSPYSYGWGSFHLGFAGSTDPEPGRCRRTDGKKWRCSRDAVPDQKYCERHINRGRHRSRKPVESHTGQAAAVGPTNTKGVPPLPSAMSSLVTSPGSGSNVVTIAQHQTTNVNGDDPILNRLQHHDQQGLSVMPSVPKQLVSLGDSLHFEFGLVPNDSLLNPSEKSSYTGYKSNNSLLEFNTEQSQDPYPIRHFIEDQSNRPAISWADEEKSDWTQLSMSGPMSLGPLGLSSASTSPNQDKTTLSKMGVAVPIMDDETVGKQNAWKVPFTWGNNTMGGPLGEVLNNASNAVGSCKGTGSPQLGASPTGVLHKSTFVSLSNSSSGGSPRGDNKMAI